MFQKKIAAVVLLAAWLLPVAWSKFGEDISANNEDNTFQDMGQATLENFNVHDGAMDIVVNIENTVNVPELWILDFEPYLFNLNALPIEEATGRLVAKNTGNCSSVYENAEFTDYLSDTYFQDQGTSALTSNGKELFTSFVRGDSVDENNRRTNQMVASTGMDVFFGCKNSNSESIWTHEGSADELEYRTNLYMINVRPKEANSASDGIAFVQSHVELIWRISRTAIANVIISSTAILWPMVDHVRVSAVFEDGEPVPDKARLELRFTTVSDSATQMVVYKEGSLDFLPENIQNQVVDVETFPPSTIEETPVCQFFFDRQTGLQKQCHQTWDFTILLDIDIPLVDFTNEIPIDASGQFDFKFELYNCDEPTNDVILTSSCELIDDSVTISTVITIQTTIFVRDEEADSITIILIALKGVNEDSLNVPEAIRGVAHKEAVTMDVKFSPSLLREDFTLSPTLVMICIGEKYAGDGYPDGCLEAPISERYVAYVHAEFLYSNYTASDLSEDVYQALDQFLYIEMENNVVLDVPYLRIVFTNLALSAIRSNYTITTVYRLMEKSRRKRDLHQKIIFSKLAIENSQVVDSHRAKRSLEEDADKDHLDQVGYIAAGCPSNAIHDAETFDCVCPADSHYDNRMLQCTFDVDMTLGDTDSDDSRPIFSVTSVMIISLFLLCVMFLKQ